MKRLRVTTFYQKVNSGDCGPVSAQMILHHFGFNVSEKELIEGMERDENIGGTYIYENGSLLLKQGLRVTLITANPVLFEREVWDKLKTKAALFKHLSKFQKRKPQKKKVVKLFKDFISSGGKVKIEIPVFEHCKKAIDKDQLVLASLYGRALGSKEGGYHYVVVSGYKNDALYVNNPLPGSCDGWYLAKDFIHAVHTSTCFDIDNGALLIVGK